MKALLYCTKKTPRLVFRQYELFDGRWYEGFKCGTKDYVGINELGDCETLNGKIVGECDYEVEEIKELGGGEGLLFYTKTLDCLEIVKQACLKTEELADYLYKEYEDSKGYAIHIKNLKVFDEPRELAYSTCDNDAYYYSEKYDKKQKCKVGYAITKAPQNMCYAYDKNGNKYVLISIHPEHLCKELNGEKTVEVRKIVLKEMLK